LDTFLYTDDLGYDWPGVAIRAFNIGDQTGPVTGQSECHFVCTLVRK